MEGLEARLIVAVKQSLHNAGIFPNGAEMNTITTDLAKFVRAEHENALAAKVPAKPKRKRASKK